MRLISSLSFAPKLLCQIINYFQNLQVKKESEVVNSSTSTDFNTSMETTLVFQTTDKEYKEEKSRYVVCIVDEESSPLNHKTNPMYKISRHFDQYLRMSINIKSLKEWDYLFERNKTIMLLIIDLNYWWKCVEMGTLFVSKAKTMLDLS